MEFRIKQHRTQQLADRLNVMVFFALGLLITNILLASLSWYALVHQRMEITPFMGGETYQKSEAVLDVHYLQMMSENFIYARLNVTPETVLENHKRLLSFVDARHYVDFSAQLHKEAQLIQKQKIASHMEILSIKPNATNLNCVVQGIVKRSVGIRALPDELMTYTLQFKYHLGRFRIERFTHQPGVNHA